MDSELFVLWTSSLEQTSTRHSRFTLPRVPGLSYGVVCVILPLTVLIQYRRVTDGQTSYRKKSTTQSPPSVIFTASRHHSFSLSKSTQVASSVIFVQSVICVYVTDCGDLLCGVCRKEFSLHRDQLSRSIVPYVNAARSVVTDTSHLVVIFVAVLVVIDLLAAVVWIYLKRSHSSRRLISFFPLSFPIILVDRYSKSVKW